MDAIKISLLLLIIVQANAIEEGFGIPGTTQTISGYDTELGTSAMCWTAHGSLQELDSLIPFPNPLLENFQLKKGIDLLPRCPQGNTLTALPPVEVQEEGRLRTGSWHNFTVSVELNATSLVEGIGGGVLDYSFVSDDGPQIALQVMACEVGTAGFCSPYKHEESNARLAAQGIKQNIQQGDSHGGTHVHSGYKIIRLPPQNGPVYQFTVQVPMLINDAGVYFPIVALQLFFRDYFGIENRYDIANAMPPSQRLLYYLEPATVLRVPSAVRVFVYGLIGVVALIITFLLWQTVKHKDHQVMKLTQGGFLTVFLATAIVSTFSTSLLEPRNDQFCRAGYPLVLVSTQVLYAITLGRLWRINALISPVLIQTLKQQQQPCFFPYFKHCTPQKVTERRRKLRKEVGWEALVKRIVVWVLPQAVLQLLGFMLQSPFYTVVLHPDGMIGRVTCDFPTVYSKWLAIVGFTWLGILMLTLMIQAHQARSLPSLFNETKDIFESTLATIAIVFIGVSIAAVANGPASSPAVNYLVFSTINLCSTLNTTLRIMLPKLKMVWRGETILVSKLLSDHKDTVRKKNELYENQRVRRTSGSHAFTRNYSFGDYATDNSGNNTTQSFSPLGSAWAPNDHQRTRRRNKIVLEENVAPARRLLLKLVNMQQKLSNVNNCVMSGLKVSADEWLELRQETIQLATTFKREVDFAWENAAPDEININFYGDDLDFPDFESPLDTGNSLMAERRSPMETDESSETSEADFLPETCSMQLNAIGATKEEFSVITSTKTLVEEDSPNRDESYRANDVVSAQESVRSEEDRRKVVEEVKQACCTIGLFAIKNHGVDRALQLNTLRISREFFDLSIDIKQNYNTNNPKEYPYGYENSECLALGKATEESGASTSRTPMADLKETFSIGPDSRPGVPARVLPKKPEIFGPTLSTYYRSMEDLAALLLSIFAQALGLPTDWFAKRSHEHCSALRILNYFPIDARTVPPGQCRAGAHTDYGPLTILLAGGPGLQVQQECRLPDSAEESKIWLDVPVVDDVFIVNLGDLMARWTNGRCAAGKKPEVVRLTFSGDRWRSPLHRVVVKGKGVRRQSIAYFCNVNGGCVVDPRDLQEDHPHYPPITAEDHLMSKYLASMKASSETGGNM